MSFDLRALTLGGAFNPRILDIPTPDAFTAKGAPDDLLRLVSLSAEERGQLWQSTGQDAMLNAALLACATLRYRDGGGFDGNGSFVYGKLNEQGQSVADYVNATAIVAQDYDLLTALSAVVKPFLGLDVPVAQAVDAQKKDFATTQPSAGGSVSPASSDSPPPEQQSAPSTTETSQAG